MRTKKDSVQCFRNATINLQNQVFQHINLYSIFDECDESSVSIYSLIEMHNMVFRQFHHFDVYLLVMPPFILIVSMFSIKFMFLAYMQISNGRFAKKSKTIN